jgi:hypothetical protein
VQREPGFARPARTGQRHQPRAAHQAAHLGQLSVAADEARHLRRQVSPQPRVLQRPQRRERSRQALPLQLEDLLGPAHVLQPVQAQIPQPHAGRQRTGQQPRRRGRHHHLAPCATAAIRAAQCTSSPTSPATVREASPQWIPIRARTPAGHACDTSARCIWTAASTQAPGEANTAKTPSP